MSYLRWSSPLPVGKVTDEEHVEYLGIMRGLKAEDFTEQSGEYKRRVALQNEWMKKHGLVTSEWYVYWSSLFSETGEDETKDNQWLAIHHVAASQSGLTVAEAREFLDGNESLVTGFAEADETQREGLRDAVRRWVDDMDKEYG